MDRLNSFKKSLKEISLFFFIILLKKEVIFGALLGNGTQIVKPNPLSAPRIAGINN
jgi:hypothetical protein